MARRTAVDAGRASGDWRGAPTSRALLCFRAWPHRALERADHGTGDRRSASRSASGLRHLAVLGDTLLKRDAAHRIGPAYPAVRPEPTCEFAQNRHG